MLIGIIAAALLVRFENKRTIGVSSRLSQGLGVFLTCGLRIRSRLNKKNRSGAHVSLGDGSTKVQPRRCVVAFRCTYEIPKGEKNLENEEAHSRETRSSQRDQVGAIH